jgi:alkylhydroperoxidase family enzyme
VTLMQPNPEKKQDPSVTDKQTPGTPWGRRPFPLPSDATLEPLLTGAAAGLPSINVFRALANAPSLAPAYMEYFGRLFKPLQLDARIERLLVLLTGKLSDCEYIWRQNVVVAKSLGISEEKLAELGRLNLEAECFTSAEAVAFKVVTETVRLVEVTDSTYVTAEQHFSPRELTEMLYVVGSYMFLARLIRTGRIPLDKEPAAVPDGFFDSTNEHRGN